MKYPSGIIIPMRSLENIKAYNNVQNINRNKTSSVENMAL